MLNSKTIEVDIYFTNDETPVAQIEARILQETPSKAPTRAAERLLGLQRVFPRSSWNNASGPASKVAEKAMRADKTHSYQPGSN